MAIDVDALKRNTDIVKVVGSYTSLTKRGHEFIGTCVAHNDTNASMTVSPQKGFVHCFGCGFHADVIDFIQEVENKDFKEACEFLNEKNDWNPRLSVPKAPPIPERETLKPPKNSRPESLILKGVGEPSKSWDYLDENGDLLGIVCRYDTDEGKEIRVWTYAKRGLIEPKWGMGHFNFPRPLFNLDKIAQSESSILMVEGEKAAEAAKTLIPQYTATTWTGGANSAGKTSFEPLRGRKVILMADNDEAGRESMLKLAETLSDPKGLNCTVKILDTSGMAEKWDIADALEEGWTNEQFIEWAKPRVSEYERIAQEPEKPKKKPELTVVKKPAHTVIEGNTIVSVPESEETLDYVEMSPSFFAHRYLETYGKDLRYCMQWNKWLYWDGDTWQHDKSGKNFKLGWQLVDTAKYWVEARRLTENQLKGLSYRAFIGGFIDLAKTDDKIATVPDDWDSDNSLMGIPGGVIDLRTGKSIDGAREQLISRKTEVSPEQGDCPLWISTLNRATGNSQEMLDYLQRVAGYILTGETKEECFFFVYGPGASGKSTFCRTLTEILKDYAQAASVDAFMAKTNQEHSTELARMAGCRLVTATETDEGARWNESRIKALTGRDKISARFMRGDLFDFQPTAKIMIAGNHKPQLRSVGEEMKRRIHLIDFPTTIPENERDRDLNEKLREEYPQILNWMIEGAIKWYKHGLNRPEAVQAATNEYLASEDGYGEWMNECCVIGSNESVSALVAYRAYKAWTDDSGEYCPSMKRFTQRLVDRGFHKMKGGGNKLVGFSMKESNTGYRSPAYYDD